MLYFLFTLLSLASLITVNARNKKLCNIFLVCIYCLLVYVATWRPETMPDIDNYKNSFILGGSEHYEPGFQWILEIVRSNTSDFRVFLLIIAMISVGLNIAAIAKYANFKTLSLLFYISYCFILHDMIQIRCAIAAALFIFAIPEIKKKRPFRFFVIVAICVLFHYSSIAFIPLYFINSQSLNKKIYYWLIPASYALVFIGVALGYMVRHIPLPMIQTIVTMYDAQLAMGEGNNINIFNSILLIRILLIYILLFYSRKLSKNNSFFILWLKIYIFSVVVYILCSDIPVMSFRLSELYQSIEYLLIPMIVYASPLRERIYSKMILIIVAGIFLYSNAIYNHLLS